MQHAIKIVQFRRDGQDRARVVELDDCLVVGLADGAGGTGNGGVAAQAVVDAVVAGAADWVELLTELDSDGARLGHGETTAIALAVTRDGIRGASVGDSEAWLVRGDDIVELTEHQARKPLVGGGGTPVAFRSGPLAGATLVVASDGLFRYGNRRDIARIASGADLAVAASALVDLVRLRTGALQDDVSIVLVRGA